MSVFPLLFEEPFLEAEDFVRFSSTFSKRVKEKIPTSQAVVFFNDTKELIDSVDNESQKISLKKVLKDQENIGDLAVAFSDCLLFAIPVAAGQVLVLVDQIDPLVARRFSEDWLGDVRAGLLAEFVLLKQARMDMETGLFNSCNLHYLLGAVRDFDQVDLMLVHLPARGRNVAGTIRYNARFVSLLQDFIGEHIVLHHLGQAIFAFITVGWQMKTFSQFATSLINFVKKEGFTKIHIGCSKGESIERSHSESRETLLLNRAWQALHEAESRGPCSFCHYDMIVDKKSHPLAIPDDRLVCYFRKLWKDEKQFCMVRFISPNNENLQGLERYLVQNEQQVKGENNELYLYLPSISGNKAEKLVKKTLSDFSQVQKSDGEKVFSAGIASYPFSTFSKTSTLLNSKKACVHGEFFGPGAVVVFDAVSLNISGDVFYAEGDFRKAVREYRRGLECDPKDVNLLNSLGVAYIFVDQYKKAEDCFRMVLQEDSDNVMALFNLGLREEKRLHYQTAIDYFDRAYQLCVSHSEKELLEDLEFHLGRLYCLTEKFNKANEKLYRLHKKLKNHKYTPQVYRYLGVSYYGMGEKKEAVKWLQRALQLNEFDAESLSLLGILYLELDQGREIALTLCERSVDIVPQNGQYLLRLATVQLQCGQLEQAYINLKKCLRSKINPEHVQRQMALYYQLLGNKKRAAYWQKKYGAA